MAALAASRKVNLFYQGITGSEQYIRKMSHKPINSIFNRYSEEGIMTGAELVNPIYGTKPGNQRFMGTVLSCVKNALGEDEASPATGLSYLNFYLKDVTAANPHNEPYDPSWNEAFRYARNHLKLVKSRRD